MELSPIHLPTRLDPSWLKEGSAFCQPMWELVDEALIQNRPPSEYQSLYVHLGRLWVQQIQQEFGAEYKLVESTNFFLLSQASDSKAKEALQFLEQCLFRLRTGMPFLPEHPGYGKWPVLCLSNNLFYRYLADYEDSEGAAEYASVGGVYLNRGYGHFALPSEDLHLYSRVLTHELTHALVGILRLPPWLDEAIAMYVEERLASGATYVIDREIIKRHRDYWTPKRMQAFWAGTSFWFPDDGQELSYHLARFIFNALYQGGTNDPSLINDFIKKAKRDDAGHSAAVEILNLDLGEVLSHLLGNGQWAPDEQIIKDLLVKTEDEAE